MPPGLHAFNSPSALHRIEHCTPSARLGDKFRARFGDKDSPFAFEGTKAHALLELKEQKEIGIINDFKFKAMVDELKSSAPDLEWSRLERATNVALDVIMTHYYEAKRISPDAQMYIEQELNMEQYLKACWGTADNIIVSDDILDVHDYKNGSGIPVSADHNPQMRAYALGAYIMFADLYGFEKIRCTILQPNIDNISVEVLTRQELLDWAEEMGPKLELSYEGKGEYHSGEWCRFCPAKCLCYYRAAEAMRIFDTGMENPGILPDSEIPRILEYADQAEAWIKDIKEYARTRALNGHNWYGFKLVEGRRPPRKWGDEEAAINNLYRAGYTDEQIYTKKLINPGEAEKLLGKTAYNALVSEFVTQADGNPTLVPESDKRIAISIITADDFD